LLKLQAAIQSAGKHFFDLPACVPHRQAGTFAPPLGQAKVAKEWERWPKAQDAMCSNVYRANAFLNAFALVLPPGQTHLTFSASIVNKHLKIKYLSL
jgi:hypothetical protein